MKEVLNPLRVPLLKLNLIYAELRYLLLLGHDLGLEVLHPFGHLLLELLIEQVYLLRSNGRVDPASG